jgi:hypothetical protein
MRVGLLTVDPTVGCGSATGGAELAGVRRGGIVVKPGSGMSFQTGTYINCPVLKRGKDVEYFGIRSV